MRRVFRFQLRCLVVNKLNLQYFYQKIYLNKQARKGFRTKDRDGDFIEFKLILMKFFKNFDQNSNQKTEFLPIGKVQNSSKNHKFR